MSSSAPSLVSLAPSELAAQRTMLKKVAKKKKKKKKPVATAEDAEEKLLAQSGCDDTVRCTSPFKGYEATCVGRESGVRIMTTNVPPNRIYDTRAAAASRPPIRREDINGVDGAYLVHNVLSDVECARIVKLIDMMGFEHARITTGEGMVVDRRIRSNARLILQTPMMQRLREPSSSAADADASYDPVNYDYLEAMYARIEEHMPRECAARPVVQRTSDGDAIPLWVPVGLNERLRFYRYEGGEVFNRHYDGCFPRDDGGEMSIYTLIVYLSDAFVGGETTFFVGRGQRTEVAVTPTRGSALIFPHGSHPASPLHEGSVVAEGLKYVLRSDVMCRRSEDVAAAAAAAAAPG